MTAVGSTVGLGETSIPGGESFAALVLICCDGFWDGAGCGAGGFSGSVEAPSMLLNVLGRKGKDVGGDVSRARMFLGGLRGEQHTPLVEIKGDAAVKAAVSKEFYREFYCVHYLYR